MNSRPGFSAFRTPQAARQRGVVLIIAMVMLVVISLLASLSIRNALSSESVSGNVRTTELANQAAETALRVCESAIAANVLSATALPAGLAAQDAQTPPRFSNMVDWWDKVPAPAEIYVIPADEVNTGGASVTFNRMPECLVERVPVMDVTNTVLSTTRTYMITARGFGPDVQDPGNTRGRPEGTEVFLQSVLEID
jgi:type IV pilus assembly protein PilX